MVVDANRVNSRPYYGSASSSVNPGPATGFAGAYTGEGLQTLYDHPDVLAADLLAQMGITNPDMIDRIANNADLGFALQLIMGGGEAGSTPGNADIVNQVASYLTGMMTPGAAQLAPDDLVAMIMAADPNSPLGKYVTEGGPQAVNNLVMAVMQSTTNPYYQTAAKGALNESSRNYYSATAKDPSSSPESYFNSLRDGAYGNYF